MEWKNIFLHAILAGYLSLVGCAGEQNDAVSSPSALILKAELRTPPVRTAQPCIIDVSLHNVGTGKYLVNKRMAPGYAHSQSRELFVAIYNKGENVDIARPTRLYSRDFAAVDDYVWLEPGEWIEGRFDMFEWYEVAPGEYEFQVFYQADEVWAPVKKGLIQGVHASPRISLTVLPSHGAAVLKGQFP